MAVYFLRARHISRGKGGRVTRAAAYRAGERILDLRTSETHDFSDRRDIPYKEVVLPANLTGRPDMPSTGTSHHLDCCCRRKPAVSSQRTGKR